ncbi:hypothetical protein BD560DRAFT_409328 [Blakeslea trispora]|nr:hypothetical protein BD560DRAFT_409328 [Blakeslea trispora]
MAPIVTAATTGSILKKSVAEDDFGSQQRRHVQQPEMCVDYLSYQFDEMDLAASWRVMTKQKKQVVDGIRLENASWRTWAKQRNNLKTISPQTLNWLKDSDVTWLYGPLHRVIGDEDPYLKPKKPTTADTLGLMLPIQTKQNQPPKLKSALKKLTQVDLLRRSATELSLYNTQRHSRTSSLSQVNQKLKAVSPAILATHRQPKLRFNTQVEQCIAVTVEEPIHAYYYEEEDMYTSSSDLETDEVISHIDHLPPQYTSSTIKKIAPARLKRSHSDQDTDDISSISSTSSSVQITQSSPMYQYSNDSETEKPVAQLCRSSSTGSIVAYKEKSEVAQPALVKTHQTATDIHKTSTIHNSGILNHIANWASSYIWPGQKKAQLPATLERSISSSISHS